MDSYDEFTKMAAAKQEHQKRVSACQAQCYDSKYPCPANKLASCSSEFQQQMLGCLKSCDAPVGLPTSRYATCMAGCEKYHPLTKIMQCRKQTCKGLDAAEREQCHQQCYESRGRCRCACD